jgi:mannose-1-phosphate guanylyltransferase
MGDDAMIGTKHVWALVLAGGEGKRLHALTTKPCGTPVPKQFCSLRGECSLIEDAIHRAAALVDTERICAIVASEHRRWWSKSIGLQRLPEENLIVQPRNRGTAVGILFGVLRILARDPDALVLLLPADRHIDDEGVLRQSTLAALQIVKRGKEYPVLLGLEPDRADTELGYIVPGEGDASGGHRVLRFVEKPNGATADEIIGNGGLWNTFIVVAAAQRLVDMFAARFAGLLSEMRAIVDTSLNRTSHTRHRDVLEMYERLPEVDFSRHLLEGQESSLRVVRVPPCGWSDLGTPRRVGDTLRRLPARDYAAAVFRRSAYLNLATQHYLLQGSAGLRPPSTFRNRERVVRAMR